MHPDTYKSIQQFLFSRMAKGMKLGLENVAALAETLNRPQDRFPSIHVAGTNGKGSTSAIIESILRAAGYNTGLYTSPHLVDMRERIQIRGRVISEEEVLDTFRRLYPYIEKTGVTFFEILTMMAFLAFSRHRVNAAVLEAGLGGRLDATNIVTPVLTVITDIGLDHTHILGNNLNQIAGEKAGILKPGVPCLSGVRRKSVQQTLKRMARSKKAPITFCSDAVRISRIRLYETGCCFDAQAGPSFYKNVFIGLAGRHQVRNAGLALLAVQKLKGLGWHISDDAVLTGLQEVRWPARLELLQTRPKFLVDSAHNPAGIRSLVRALNTVFQYEKLHLVFGVLEDKDYKTMLSAITPLASRVVLTLPLSDRALAPEKLLSHPGLVGKHAEAVPDIAEAVSRAMALTAENDMICCAGSMFLVGEVLRLWHSGRFTRGKPDIEQKERK